MEEYVNEMLGELKHAYHVREEQLSSVAQDCRAQMRVIIRKHEALIAAYRWDHAFPLSFDKSLSKVCWLSVASTVSRRVMLGFGYGAVYCNNDTS